jgi:hypothetical protein
MCLRITVCNHQRPGETGIRMLTSVYPKLQFYIIDLHGSTTFFLFFVQKSTQYTSLQIWMFFCFLHSRHIKFRKRVKTDKLTLCYSFHIMRKTGTGNAYYVTVHQRFVAVHQNFINFKASLSAWLLGLVPLWKMK